MDKLRYCSDVNVKPTQSKSGTFWMPRKSSRETGTFLLKVGQSRENWTNWNNSCREKWSREGCSHVSRYAVLIGEHIHWHLDNRSALPSGSSSQRREIHVNVGAFTIWHDITTQRTSILIQMAVITLHYHRQKMYFVCNTLFPQVSNFIRRTENNVDT